MSGYISEPGLFFPNGLRLGAVNTMQEHKGTEDEHQLIGFLYNTQVLPSNGSMHSNTFLHQVYKNLHANLRAHIQFSLFCLLKNRFASQVYPVFQKGFVYCPI